MPASNDYVEADMHVGRKRRLRNLAVNVGAGTLLTIIMLNLPGRAGIPPLVESDYCYLLTAADRFADGNGLTTTYPVAPLQPWDWQHDWTFLTKWPCGYPILVAATRCITGSTLSACALIAAIACAASMIGWFHWSRRCVPQGVPGTLLALLAAACSVSVAGMINPTTDQLLIAAIPYILLLVIDGVGERHAGPPRVNGAPHFGMIVTAGLLSGFLFWIRYASIFVPCAIGVFLGIIALSRRRTAYFRCLQAFCFSAMAPVALLMWINHALGTEASTVSQLNLGTNVGFHLSVSMLLTAWTQLTEFSFYAHRAFTKWIFAAWPALLALACLTIPSLKQATAAHLRRPPVVLSAVLVATLLGVLIVVTTLFAEKFNYIALGRYYEPVKPLYFLLFVAPLLALPARYARWGVAACACLGIAWFMQHEWPRAYERMASTERESTPYGQWANCFAPNAGDVYERVRAYGRPDVAVVSNFHEWIMLETGIPALPIPPDEETLGRWVRRIRRERRVPHVNVVFVLERDNKWRDYWIPETPTVLAEFGLSPQQSQLRHPNTYVIYHAAAGNSGIRVSGAEDAPTEVNQRDAITVTNMNAKIAGQ